MPLITSAITAICVGLAAPGQYSDACRGALEAGAKQSGAYEVAVEGEKRAMIYGQESLSKTAMETGAASVFIYRAIKTKSVAFKMPKTPIADTITTQATLKVYSVNLNWNIK